MTTLLEVQDLKVHFEIGKSDWLGKPMGVARGSTDLSP